MTADVSLVDKAGTESTRTGYRPLFRGTIMLNAHPFPNTTANLFPTSSPTVCAGKNLGAAQSHVAGSQDCSETLPPSGEMRYDSYAARTTGLGLQKLNGEGGKKSGTKTVAGLEKAKQCRRQEKRAAGGGEAGA